MSHSHSLVSMAIRPPMIHAAGGALLDCTLRNRTRRPLPEQALLPQLTYSSAVVEGLLSLV